MAGLKSTVTARPVPALTVAQGERRYLLLTALRWLPVGITIPVTVLLALSRGLTLADVGLVFLAHSLLVALLELPTGGLADALGRRPVLVASGVLHLLSCLAYATAGSLAGFLLGAGLLAVGRALDSGPLEAWFVDAVRSADPAADLAPGLARAGVADCLALAAGAVVGGLGPGLLGVALALPYLAAVVLDLLSIGAVLLLVTPAAPAADGVLPAGVPPSALTTVRDGVLAVPGTVRSAVALAVGDSALRRVLVLSLVCGTSLGTLELLGPALFAELSGSSSGGSGVFGVVMAASFLGGATGYALARRSRRLARGSTRWAVAALTLGSGLALLTVAAADTVLVAAAAYAGFYLLNAAGWPLLRALAHARVGAGQRATVVSAWSLALQAGGALSNVVSPRLGGTGRAYAVAAGLAVVGAVVAAGLPRDAAPPDPVPLRGPGSPAAPTARRPAAPARQRRPR